MHLLYDYIIFYNPYYSQFKDRNLIKYRLKIKQNTFL